MDLTLVVLAAGLSSRYGEGFKQVDAVGPAGEWLLDYGVYDAIRVGFTHVVLVARPEIEQTLRGRVARLPRHVIGDVVFQRSGDLPEGRSSLAPRQKPWGTGQALLAATSVVRAPFAVVNADDFYGAEAYRAMAEWLTRARWTAPHPAAMIGYRLRDTLSPNAAVSRAICRVGIHGYVQQVTEVLGVVEVDGRIHGRTLDEGPVELGGDELVSMNFWGFQPPVFGMLRAGFARFLDTRGLDPTAEFLLSSAVNDLMGADEIALEVLSTDARWFGMTSSADRELVAARLAQLTARGEYPSPLFAA